jgi:hypothetical protein
MRIERTSYPWESEDADPRLELRRRAAESQRDLDVEDEVFDDLRSTDWEEWGLTDETRGEPVATSTSRR